MIEYKVLVVDDYKEIERSFPLYSMELEDRGLNVKFDIVSTIRDFKEKKDEQFDILMVDYNLRNGFFEDETMSMGTDFINDFRKKNMINKIIFYSTEFRYDLSTRIPDIQLNISQKEYYELINNYKIDAIVPKNNTEMLVDMIENCIKNLDPISKFLRKTLNKFAEDSDLLYYEAKGSEYTIAQLLEEYQKDSEVGKEFGENLLETIATLLLEYRY
ncbi:hypothetical protein UN717_07535 [Streptococcus suis]|uniref:hypothetical protein n=3 Tax=Streptococcus suis TaxID=1307 RepID=UPI001582DB8E|nr:hypothetical protein [Streptococcus suis]MDY7600779.1 hypothetical protein [Streptococcus suis]HEL1769328.1 hypothetical protein [Streptococcus suis]HEL1782205.1 hypothetical protein [Streptococcus suis]HEL2571331.1 hypothetical protein [Streptococcus suis]